MSIASTFYEDAQDDGLTQNMFLHKKLVADNLLSVYFPTCFSEEKGDCGKPDHDLEKF